MTFEPQDAWPPPPPPPLPEPPVQRNSPVKLAGVLVLVLVVVGAVAVPSLNLPGPTVAGRAVPADPQWVAQQSPSGRAAPVVELETNPLLAPGRKMPETTCRLPSLRRSEEQLQSYYEAGMRCLDAAWQPVLSEAGEPFSTPVLQIRDETESSCGGLPPKEEATAFYCPADNAIHMPRKRLLETVGTVQAAHLAVLAHEYGHHVQSLSGIMEAAYEKKGEFAEGSAEELEMTRRMELQANCFAGLFLASTGGRGSISRSLAKQGVEEFENTVGSDSHGSVPNQLDWARAGFQAEVSACNTFGAPAEKVR